MAHYLSAGYKLNIPECDDEYIIKEVMGQGASTITYLTEYVDASGGISECILKEFYPYCLEISREDDGTLKYLERDKQRYLERMNRFKEGGDQQIELRKLAHLKNETPPTPRIFRANNTCYIEVTLFEGMTFDKMERIPLLKRMEICLAIAKVIKRYHENGVLYLDLKPENIFILTNSAKEIVGDMVEFIDFDSVMKKDSIMFGNSLSYTEAWAAPEQINPYGYLKISEKTDIYALGEMVFWCVFERHSTEEEHREYSTYSYDEIKSENISSKLRYPVEKGLTELFHNTIRTSVKNRFSSAEDVIRLLELICEELRKKAYLITKEISPQKFFVGRERELSEIRNALKMHDIVFVSGIAGIGKSELIKQYIGRHRDEYDNVLYWTYEGNLDSMAADEKSVSISNVLRLEEESDAQYAKRKLKMIRELCHKQTNLIVIDNFDKLIDEVPEQETWELIKSIRGKILISTRSMETYYHTVFVEPMKNISDLVKIFCKYCPVADSEIGDVENIIEKVGYNTLVVELLAHQTKASRSTPKQTLEIFVQGGMRGLSEENIRLFKDEKIVSDTVFHLVERIFSMESMTEEQLIVLGKLALMPVNGVSAKSFVTFFSYDNFNNIDWLIRHGWVHACDNCGTEINLHPAIASVVMEHLKENETLLNKIFVDCYGAIKSRKVEISSEAEQVWFADSLAISTVNKYRIRIRSAAVFVEQYVDLYSKYGNREGKLTLINFAIETLEKCIGSGKYSGILEQCYYHKVEMLIRTLHYEKAIKMCKTHLKIAKKQKDYFWLFKWHLILSDYYNGCEIPKYFFTKNVINSLVLIYYFIIFFFKKNTRHYLIENLDCGYMGKNRKKFFPNLVISMAKWFENVHLPIMFCKIFPKSKKTDLYFGKIMREIFENDKETESYSNRFEIEIDKARIAVLSKKHEEAEKVLKEVVISFKTNKLIETYTLYRVHEFLGQILLWKNTYDFKAAISEFENCLRIGEKLMMDNTYRVKLELGYLYIISDRMDEAFSLNTDLWKEIQILELGVRKKYFADILRNLGCLYYKKRNMFAACDMLQKACEEYKSAYTTLDMINVGKARTYSCLSELYYSDEFKPNLPKKLYTCHIECVLKPA